MKKHYENRKTIESGLTNKPFLSLSGDIPIAKIPDSKDYVYIIDPLKDCCNKHGNKCSKLRSCCEKCPHQNISYSLEIPGIKPLPALDCKETSGNSEHFRECIYVTGQSGAGKSYWIANYIRQFQKMYPEREVYLLSKVENDPAYEDIKMTKIQFDDTWEDDPIELADLDEGSLVVFDDADRIANKKIKDNVEHLRNEILEEGRHKGIFAIITSHKGTDGKNTKIILNETSKVIVYPRTMVKRHLYYILEQYYNLSKKQIKKIEELNSRWVLVNRDFPQYVMYENGIYIP
jgi:hypothetical protein